MGNIIRVLQAGNREQFHSSFIAWLLENGEEHGFGDNFLRQFLELAGEEPCSDYEVFVEHTEGRCRYDILLQKKDGSRRIAVENKTKSIGHPFQIEKYENKVDKVLLISLVKENYASMSESGYKHIPYSDLVKIVESLECSPKYKALIDDYCNYVKATTNIYDALDKYCEGQSDYASLSGTFECGRGILAENDNDRRFIQLLYYHNFIKYLSEKHPELILGTGSYNEGDATRWIVQKNMQSNSFMEALIYKPQLRTPPIRLKNDLHSLYDKTCFLIAPRIELWISINNILNGQTSPIGRLLLGTWTKEMHEYFRTVSPYKDIFKAKGSRNFHSVEITVEDLRYTRMHSKLRESMELIYDFS